jgi:hypothetical protein
LAAVVLGVYLYAVNTNTGTSTAGRIIFQGFAILALVYCLASGRRLTADCLSAEKREGTLGLLFLTDLKGYDVVLGKLAATSVNAFYCLLGMFPVMGVSILMGGVSSGEFWRMTLVLVNTFLLSLAIGMLASVISWESRRAMGVNFLLLLGIVAAPAACAGAIAYSSPSHRVVAPLLYSCPVYSFELSFDTQYRWQKVNFWSSIAVVHAITWLLAGLASKRVPKSWQDLPEQSSGMRWRQFWQTRAFGKPIKRASLRKRLLAVNPFFWLAARSWFKPFGVWIALSFIAIWWLFILIVLDTRWTEESFCLLTVFLLNCLLKLWVAVEAGQRLAEDQKLGALELLLSTPLMIREILTGQLRALRRQFLGPLLLVLLVEIILVNGASLNSFQTRANILSFGIGSMVLLNLDILALIGVAIESALTARSPNIASVRTILRILILPSVLFLAIRLGTLFSGTGDDDTSFYIALWFWLGVGVDLLFGLPAWWRVANRFRQLAVRRHYAVAATGKQEN